MKTDKFLEENKKIGVLRMSKKKRGDITAKSDDSFKAVNYAEYSVVRTSEGKYKLHRMLAILVYALFPVLLISAAMIINSLVKGIGTVLIMTSGALVPLIIWMLVYFTWPFFSHSYHYEIEGAEMTITLHYGARYEKTLYFGKVREMSKIAPYEAHKSEVDSYISNGAEVIMAASSMSACDLYYAYITEKNTVIFFEATEQSLKTLKYYNSEAIEVAATRR